jgi:hypothetical protein
VSKHRVVKLRASRFLCDPTSYANLKEIGAMGSVYTEREIKDLKPKDRAALKRHAVQQLRTSREIHRIIMTDPKLFPALLKRHPNIRQVLRKKLSPTLKRLHKKK